MAHILLKPKTKAKFDSLKSDVDAKSKDLVADANVGVADDVSGLVLLDADIAALPEVRAKYSDYDVVAYQQQIESASEAFARDPFAFYAGMLAAKGK